MWTGFFLIPIGIMKMHLKHALNQTRKQSNWTSSNQIIGGVNESSMCAKNMEFHQNLFCFLLLQYSICCSVN
jgi:hypothetical protein